MQYTDYIKAYNDQMERQAQLINQYNQQPIKVQNRFLWATTTVERHTSHKINMTEVASIIGGILLVGSILVLSIWL